MRLHRTLQICQAAVARDRKVLVLSVAVRCRVVSLRLAVARRIQQSFLTHRRGSGGSAFMEAAALAKPLAATAVAAKVGALVMAATAAAAALAQLGAEVAVMVVLVVVVVVVALSAATAAKASPILNFMQIWGCEYVSDRNLE